MASSITVEKVDRPELAKHDSSILDLVFVMDCTGSMGSYIESAKQNIRSIVEEIVVSEKSDVRLALIEYRDHPPQDMSFVTREHDFTSKVNDMRAWLDACSADGGGDLPEAVADGLHAVLKLSWRDESTKICVLIADAPPHGLQGNDSFPNGCPNGFDPMKIVREIAAKHITLYVVGVEPLIVPYRDFFMSLAYITGGQYVPMVNAKLLAQVIVGGVREEITLERLMQSAQEDINREMQRAEAEGVDEDEKIKRINNIFSSRNIRSQQMTNTFGGFSAVSTGCYSKCTDMNQMKHQFSTYSSHAAGGSIFGAPITTSTFSPFGTSAYAAPTSGFSFGAPPVPGTSSVFGASTNPAPTSGFSFGAPPVPGTSSVFGASTNPAPTSGFGTKPVPGTAAFYGASANPAPTSGSFFGAPTATSTGSFFGTSTNPAPTTGFGFGTTPASNTSSVFGAPTATSTASVFGTSTNSVPATGFGFGTTPASNTSSAFGTSTNPAPASGFNFGSPVVPTATDVYGSSANVPSTSAQYANQTYELTEQDFSQAQATRVYQKWQNRHS